MSDEQEVESADEPADAEPDDEPEGIQDEDFIEIAYTVRVAEDGEVVDTTDEELAEDEGFDVEERDFGPRTVVVGGQQLFDPVDDAVIGGAEGDTGTVDIPATEAFGEFDQDEVRTVSADKIPEDDRYPGAHVDIDGQHGHVETIIGGRARVDFNHPLAGDDLEYEYEILDVITDPIEQAKGLISARFDVEPNVWIETDDVEEEVETDDGDTETQTTEKETLYIESVPELQFNQQWMFGKQQVAQDIIERLDIDRVIVQEIIDAQPAGPMGGMGGMMGGGAGDEDLGDLEDALEDADVDAEDLAEEIDDEDIEDATPEADDG